MVHTKVMSVLDLCSAMVRGDSEMVSVLYDEMKLFVLYCVFDLL